MTPIPTLFGGLTLEAFLHDYWRKRPLLVRGAMPGPVIPLKPPDLLDLACQEDISARLILEKGGDYPWEVRFGPFEPEDFEDLPDSHWTILVQEVDRHVLAVNDILAHFRFVPNWRLDDIQVSYASLHGSAGPHVDNYDVFLLQGHGRRRWQISHDPAPLDVDFLRDLDIEILPDFTPDAEWILAPGDMLYLPPRFPHWGVALGPCMTYSIGFRAPDHQKLVLGYLEEVAERADSRRWLEDGGCDASQDPGRIAPVVLQQVRAIVRDAVEDEAAIERWFGGFLTEPQRGFYPAAPHGAWTQDRLRKALTQGYCLRRRAVAYLAYTEGNTGTRLYACGSCHDLTEDLADAAPLITGAATLDAAAFGTGLDNMALMTLLAALVNDGCLIVV